MLWTEAFLLISEQLVSSHLQQPHKMPFRFRKRLKLFPGLFVNLSKKGASLSLGGRGATINVNRQGVQETVGLPGSGVSYLTRRRKFSKAAAPPNAPRQPVTAAHVVYLIAIALVILWILAHAH
jgi:hypothetical protein